MPRFDVECESKSIEEESSSGSSQPSPLSRNADILTRESSADKVDSPFEILLIRPLPRRHNIGVSRNVGPVPFEHARACLVDLDLPDALVACPFEAEVESAYSGEQ